jgi:error-prone DNA polymerase
VPRGSGFVHLHTHSTWSLLDGAIAAEELPYLAAELGYEAVALTDHDALTGAVRFSKACAAAGVKPIFGAELTLPFNQHLTVIARNQTGYANLCRLISAAHLGNERGKPATTMQAIAERSDGLFVLSGCERGEVARLAAAGRMPQAIEAARRWRRAIGDGYRIEVFDHRGYGHRALRNRLLAVAKETGITAVATNDVHYARPEDAGTHELLHAIKDIVPLSKTQTIRANSEYGFKSPKDMRALFADAPEAADETMRIAEACDVDLGLGRYHFPHIAVPDGDTAAGWLRRRCYEGAARRFPRLTRQIEDRLEHELHMIIDQSSAWAGEPHGAGSAGPRTHGAGSAGPLTHGFSAYFLMVADIVEHTKRVLGIRCACRGSAAGSLVCYVLGISDVDPVRYDLLFERFMNARREELPDIDIDVESHRRDEVLAHVLGTYGKDQTAMCCMVDTFRARMAIREVGKALGLPPDEIDVVAKAFPRIRAASIPQAMAALPELKGSNLGAGQLEQLFELCMTIDGFPRHLALHPSGVILSSADLADRVPMQESYGGFTMLQADKHDVEDLGLVKLDVLGVRMLSAMAHASDEILRIRGARPKLDGADMDDAVTFRLIRTSKTLGCFQIESPGQRDLLARLQPDSFEDLIVEISLFRPGPVISDMVAPYLNRRHGFAPLVYPHPKLAPILKETNGIVVYHEQLIRVIAEVTGCSLADADYVRRHLDSGRPGMPGAVEGEQPRPTWELPTAEVAAAQVDERSDMAGWFKAAGMRNGYSAGQVEALWAEVFAFASFGFCKSHAAAFALPTYLSSWLKAHYPAEFYAGLLTHDPGMYPRRLIVADARQLGIPILPLDINHSGATYRVEPIARAASDGRQNKSARAASDGRQNSALLGVRLALSEVRDISAAETSSIVAGRADRPFTSLEDLWRRTELSLPVLENLVHVGALDAIRGDRSRRELLWRVADLANEPKARPGSQLGFSFDEPITQALPGLPPYTAMEETEAELAIGGIDARRHVMDLYRPLLVELGCTPADRLGAVRNDSIVWVAGVKVSSQTPAIRSGQRIIFLTLDDLTGPLDVTVFERVQPWCARTAFHSWLLLATGILRKRGGASFTRRTEPGNVGVTIVAEELFDLAELAHDRRAGHSLPAALGRQRAKQRGGSIEAATQPSARLWHASGGSAGH